MAKGLMTTVSSHLSFMYARTVHAVTKRLASIGGGEDVGGSTCAGLFGAGGGSSPRMGLLTSSQYRTGISRIFLMMGVMVIVNFYKLSLYSDRTISFSFSSQRAPSPINIWHQSAQCKAKHLSTESSIFSNNLFPYAVVRDAVVDRRPSVELFFTRAHNDSGSKTVDGESHGQEHGHDRGVRVLLLVTVHNSARLSWEHSVGRVVRGENETHAFDVTVEYTLHATSFLLRHPNDYKPGTRTVHGRQVTEWHVGLYIKRPSISKPSLRYLFDQLFSTSPYSYEAKKLKLKLSLTLHRYGGKLVHFTPTMTLACINAWSVSGLLPLRSQVAKHTQCTKSGRAVLISGGALYGKKQMRAKYYKELAHFAARALTGVVRYDSVVITVVSASSMSDKQIACGDWGGCLDRMRGQDRELLERIGEEMGAEFERIGMNKSLLKRVALVPVCTLGSDAGTSEQWDPCSQSKHSGQYWASTLGYATISKFYKWAANHDIDEFFAPAPYSIQIKGKGPMRMWKDSAAKLFDDAHSSIGVERYGGFVMQWLNFKVSSDQDARDLTVRLARARVPILEDASNTSKSSKCYQRKNDETGKSVVHCEAGLGFTIHHPVILRKGKGRGVPRLEFKQGKVGYRGLRAWHARMLSSKGTCMYRSGGEGPLREGELEGKDEVTKVDENRNQGLMNDDDKSLLKRLEENGRKHA